MLKKLSLYVAVATVGSAGFMGQAMAAGYEKSTMWGGRTAGVAGIATPYIQGSEALYFNPAGLVSDKLGQDISLNVSPTTAQFSGPVPQLTGGSQESTSTHALTWPSALIYGANVNDRIGFGIGGYVSGGNQAEYEGVGLGGGATADLKTQLQITELSAGVGYKISDSLKVGAAYRIVTAQANLATVTTIAANTPGQVYLSSLKDTEYTGFRLGAQYKWDDKTLLGLTYRSEVNFKADGKQSAYTLGGAQALAATDTTLRTTLPMAVTLGGQHDISEAWKGLAELAWTQYSRVKSVTFTTGSLTQDWQDQFNVRLGGEYRGWSWPVRFGYEWTNQVTSSQYARPTFVPPGMGHTLTAGSGQSFSVFGNPLQLDGAVEWAFASGNSKNAVAGSDTGDGKFGVNELALHLGAVYAF